MTEVPHLAGRSASYSAASPVAGRGGGGGASNPHEARLQWVVSGGGSVSVSVDYQRGGKLSAEVDLPAGSKL